MTPIRVMRDKENTSMIYDERLSFKKGVLNRAFALNKENNIDLKFKIENTHLRLNAQTKWWGKNDSRSFKLRIILENNIDLRSSIFKLFYVACCFNMFIFALVSFANMVYFFNLLAFVLGCDIFDETGVQELWPWKGLVITNSLWLIFLIHFISDYYKICLRGHSRNQLLNLFFVDLLTLNFLSVIGISIFARNRALMLKVFGDDEIKFENSNNHQAIKKFAWVILKVELISCAINLIIFLTVFLIGYFVENNIVKNICLVIMFFSIVFLMVGGLPSLIWAVIVHKLLVNLTKTNSTHYFLTTIRFLTMLNSYYIAIFLNFLTLNNFEQEYILQNW